METENTNKRDQSKFVMIDQDGISHLDEVNEIEVQLTYLTNKVENLISTKSKSIRGMKHVEDAAYAI